MDTNKKLSDYDRSERQKEYSLWIVAAILGLLFVVLNFIYFHSGEWDNEILEGTVTKVVSRPADGDTLFTIEIDLGTRKIWITEAYPPEIVVGDSVKVRRTSSKTHAKNTYFRLRKPRA